MILIESEILPDKSGYVIILDTEVSEDESNDLDIFAVKVPQLSGWISPCKFHDHESTAKSLVDRDIDYIRVLLSPFFDENDKLKYMMSIDNSKWIVDGKVSSVPRSYCKEVQKFIEESNPKYAGRTILAQDAYL